MLFSDGITDLGILVGKSASDSEILAKLKLALNNAKLVIGKAAEWKQLIVPNNELVIESIYDTGTASITTGSRTVTLVGGTVSSDWKGWYFNGGTRSYEIVSVSVAGNTLTLKTPIIEDSGSVDYYVSKLYYRVPNDVRLILPDENYVDLPMPLEIVGYDDYVADYNGTMSVTKNSNVMTGTGTTFLSKVSRGDLIQVSANYYRVKYVSSDTELVMTNKAIEDFSGDCVIRSDTPYIATVGSSIERNSSEKELLKYKYIRNVYKMVNDSDETEFPEQFDEAILMMAKSQYSLLSNSASYATDLQVAQLKVEGLKMNRDLMFYSHKKFKIVIPDGYGRGKRY